MTIAEIQAEICSEFSFFEDWQQKYEYLIDMGKSLPPLDESLKMEDKLIKGCQSKLWLVVTKEAETLVFTADADAIISKGIAALILRVYSHQKPADIIASDESFLQKIGLNEFLSITRSNGLLALIKQIKMYAIAFSVQ